MIHFETVNVYAGNVGINSFLSDGNMIENNYSIILFQLYVGFQIQSISPRICLFMEVSKKSIKYPKKTTRSSATRSPVTGVIPIKIVNGVKPHLKDLFNVFIFTFHFLEISVFVSSILTKTMFWYMYVLWVTLFSGTKTTSNSKIYSDITVTPKTVTTKIKYC